MRALLCFWLGVIDLEKHEQGPLHFILFLHWSWHSPNHHIPDPTRLANRTRVGSDLYHVCAGMVPRAWSGLTWSKSICEAVLQAFLLVNMLTEESHHRVCLADSWFFLTVTTNTQNAVWSPLQKSLAGTTDKVWTFPEKSSAVQPGLSLRVWEISRTANFRLQSLKASGWASKVKTVPLKRPSSPVSLVRSQVTSHFPSLVSTFLLPQRRIS